MTFNDTASPCDLVEVSTPQIGKSDSLDTDAPNVNLLNLVPGELIKIPFKVKGTTLSALLDSGASVNIIKKSICDMCEGVLDGNVKNHITGLGSAKLKTIGRTNLECETLGLGKFTCEFNVLPDDVLTFDIILGLQFLHCNNIRVDMSRRIVSREDRNGGIISFHIDGDGSVTRVMHENVPVVAARDTKLSCSRVTYVPVSVNVVACSTNQENVTYFYEGKPKNSKLESTSGIIGLELEENKVAVKFKKGTSAEEGRIKKGERLGFISTLVEVEPVEELGDRWSEEDLQGKIRLADNIDRDQKLAVYQMLARTQVALSKNEVDIGRANVIPHRIELNDEAPVWQRPRKFSEPVNREIDRQCKELLELGIIENSDSPWSSPVVPVMKKPSPGSLDREIRMCIDYRKLNERTVTEKFPMPDLAEQIYSAHNSKFFTKLDLIKGYYQIPLDKSSRKYTAFTTPIAIFSSKLCLLVLKIAA